MSLWSEWWVWMSAALAMATLEVIVPGWIFLGFAMGALVMGVLLLIGLTGMSLPITLVVFALLTWRPARNTVEAGVSFWHMVDLVWILLFPTLYLLR